MRGLSASGCPVRRACDQGVTARKELLAATLHVFFDRVRKEARQPPQPGIAIHPTTQKEQTC